MIQRKARPVMPTPQSKILNVAARFGNSNLKDQQGTTAIIYDTIPIDGRTDFRFFEEANTRQFPFTNMSSEGNRLGVGRTLAVERAYLNVITVTDGAVTDVQPLTLLYPAIAVGELGIDVGNSQILKQVPILSFLPGYNKSAYHTLDTVFEFDTQSVIMPLINFVFNVRTAGQPAIAGQYLRLTVEGTGSLLAPRQTM